jgi:uncharacterized membrane protein YfcA
MIFVLFFIVAVAYSSVGFGGGSSYLALLTLWAMPYEEIRILALLCNIAVVSWNIWMHRRTKNLDLKAALQFVVLSVPSAFLMSKIRLDDSVYFIILGGVLLLAGVLLVFNPVSTGFKVKKKTVTHIWVGGFIGAISGLVGIGGGIFLSPYLHFAKWGNALKISALSSFFILINSLAGLTGHVASHGWSVSTSKMIGLLIAVLMGSVIGNFLAYRKLKNAGVKKLTGALVLALGARLLFQYV